MLDLLLKFLLSVLTSEDTKSLIGIGVKKLLDHKTDGITKELANVMIDGIAKSKSNETTAEVFDVALKQLK